jgi:hypothetical protein
MQQGVLSFFRGEPMGIKLSELMSLMNYRHFRGRTGEEDELAIAVATYLRAATLEGRLTATWTCIPHEVGAVTKANSAFKAAQTRYAKAKAMGLIAGSADYVFVWPSGGLWLELKSASGSLSPAQRSFREWCRATGSDYMVCRTLDAVVEKLIEVGVLRP